MPISVSQIFWVSIRGFTSDRTLIFVTSAVHSRSLPFQLLHRLSLPLFRSVLPPAVFFPTGMCMHLPQSYIFFVQPHRHASCTQILQLLAHGYACLYMVHTSGKLIGQFGAYVHGIHLDLDRSVWDVSVHIYVFLTLTYSPCH